MSAVSGSSSVQNQVNVQGTQGTNQATPSTGSGSVGHTGPVPVVVVVAYSMVLESFQAMMPTMSSDQTSVLMSEIATALKDTINRSEKDKIANDTETKKAQLGEKERTLNEANEKLKKAEEERKSGNIFTILKLAFQALGALIMGLIGGLLIATGAGAALGALMIASAAIMLIMVVDSAMKMSNPDGLGIAGQIHKAIHPNDLDGARKADMGFGISMAILGIAAAIATFVVNPAGSMSTFMSMAMQLGQIAGAATTILSAATDIGAGALNYQATENTSKATKLQAEGKEMEGFIQSLEDTIDQSLQHLMAAGDKFNAILDAIVDGMMDRSESVTKAKFRG